jgi:hypothetical protein
MHQHATKQGVIIMRKLPAALATLGLASLAAIVPATSAQASTACDNAWARASSGSFYAYDYTNCSSSLGSTESWDSNWGNSSGPFQGTDNNRASSVLHKGTSGKAVAVYNSTQTPDPDATWTGGHTCISKAEYYVDDLSRNTFTGGVNVNNAISAHKWVWNSACGKFMS